MARLEMHVSNAAEVGKRTADRSHLLYETYLRMQSILQASVSAKS
jgi:hypothetical protein